MGHVGIFGLAERRWDTDVDGVQRGDDAEVAGRVQLSLRHQFGQFRVGTSGM
jgi:hypothetical protein